MQNKVNKNKEITEMKVELTELPEPVTTQDDEPEINKGNININNDSEQESALEVEQSQNEEPQQLSEDKIIELKNMRYEHMFKFIWFFWAVFTTGVAMFSIFDIKKDPITSTTGPFLIAMALTLLFITAKYLICEKDIFVFDKELYKNCDVNITKAERLYIAIGMLIKCFFFGMTPLYLLLLSFSTSFSLNIYNIISQQVTAIVMGIAFVISAIFMIIEKIDCIKLKENDSMFKNPLNEVHLIVVNHISIFIFLFTFCITLQKNMFTA